MQFNNILDKIFAQPTGIKVLRFMVLNKPSMTGRELARFCRISHMQAYRVLGQYEAQGILVRRSAGNSYIYSLNEKNVIVNKFLRRMFEPEKTLLPDLLNEFLREILPYALSITLFGSAAEGTERPDSDVDILILLKEESGIRQVKNKLEDIEIGFFEKTGNRLAPIILTPNEFKNKIGGNKSLFNKIMEGKTLFGKELRRAIKQ
jgi:predicted nucleotidyltransferase